MSSPESQNIIPVDDFTMGGPCPDVCSLIVGGNSYGVSSFRPCGDLSARVNWDVVHATVQDALTHLTKNVLTAGPGVWWRAGRTSGRMFPLFSYRLFYAPGDSEVEPIVVGITFLPCDSGVRVAGDVSGEESGRIYFDEDCERLVVADPRLLVNEASRIARRLAAEHEIVLRALKQRDEGPSDS